MKLDYALIDPTGNMTILVETPVDPAFQPAYAAALMAKEPSAEQVGFLSPGEDGCDLTLRMAGGEFCGNASLSAAALWCADHGVSSARLRLSVSGAADPVAVESFRLPSLDWMGAVTMPKCAPPETVTLPLSEDDIDLPLVDMGGIRHLILERPMARETAERLAPLWCAILDAPALGLMQLDLEVGCLTPLVYVPAADTLYWERSCASGTAATGCYLAHRAGRPQKFRFTEPGGILEVHADPDGQALLRGCAKIVRRAAAEVEIWAD